MKKTVSALIALAVFGIATALSAECKSDAECQNGNACVEGACAAPSAAAPAETAAPKPGAGALVSDERDAAEPASQDADTAEAVAPPAPTPTEATGEAAADAQAPVAENRDEAAPALSLSTAQPPANEAPVGGAASDGTNLALVAGIGGLVVGGAVVGMHTALAFSLDGKDGLRYGLWGGTLGLVGVTAPLVYAGGVHVRKRNPEVTGTGFLPVMGWVSYILYLELSVVSLGISETDVFTGKNQNEIFIGTMSGLGLLSLVSFATEALIVRSRTKATIAAADTKPYFAPVVATIRTDARTTGATLGLAGYF